MYRHLAATEAPCLPPRLEVIQRCATDDRRRLDLMPLALAAANMTFLHVLRSALRKCLDEVEQIWEAKPGVVAVTRC